MMGMIPPKLISPYTDELEAQFDMLEIRIAEQEKDTKDALDAAFAAQKEVVTSQIESYEKSITKPISPHTGEPYDPAWGTIIHKSPPSLLWVKSLIGGMIIGSVIWFWFDHSLVALCADVLMILIGLLLSVPYCRKSGNILGFHSPLVSPAEDAFPFHYHSPFEGYQPTDTPPPQSPPQGGSVIAPVSDKFQSAMHTLIQPSAVSAMQALAQAVAASKVTLSAKHQEIEPYTPQPQYEDMVLAPADWQGMPYEDDLSEDDIQAIMML